MMFFSSHIVRCLLFFLLIFSSCEKDHGAPTALFKSIKAKDTGVDFRNDITENETVNYFTYPYLYMGGGIAIGDVNNDGLQDLYFTSNMGENKLYLNKTTASGELHFEDISFSAGVKGDERWDTGVTMVDVNADGWLDIYVSVSGKWSSTKNMLFINNQDLTFTEEAEKYGLADAGQSTQATFFDYDRDGDLDVYVANYPPLHFKSPNFVYSQNMLNPKLETSDHLYRNDGPTFTDITTQAGVLNFGLSLSASVGDFNNDGWQDIYVSNDFAAPDFLYINNQDGSFSNRIKETTAHTAYYGMGTDVADFNNDGLLDILQVDMTPEDNFRSKANMASMNPAGFKEMIDLGLTYQYMENALQINQGITEEGLPRFGDISRMTGTSLTDWSWSPLFADLDNDGWKDIHITNGTRRDINNKDYFKKIKKDHQKTDLEKSKKIPAQRIENCVFKNQGDLSFEKKGDDWGLNFNGFSNGSAYGDLDNDGDLDLVVNNIDDPASIYENQGNGNNWLRIKLLGNKNNPNGLGARVEIQTNGIQQITENQSTRGFQSGSEPLLHFGLGKAQIVDFIKIKWADGKEQILENISGNQVLTLAYEAAVAIPKTTKAAAPFFTNTKGKTLFTHQENEADDFKKERLLPHATSQFGPGVSVGDVNNDGLFDFFVGGAKDQSSALFLQKKDGSFQQSKSSVFEDDKTHEDMDALFFDADGDGWEDLYVVSGGNEKEAGASFYNDRFYWNRKGTLVKSVGTLPMINNSGSKVKASDIDQDGDLDLVVTGRLVPHAYGYPAKSFLLLNEQINGQTVFKDVTVSRAPDLEKLGMATDLVWTDFDQDGDEDLVIVGEWMPVCFFENQDGFFKSVTEKMGAEDTNGWWFSIAAHDLDQDGKEDLVLGNLGENYKYQAKEDEPFELFVNDFDKNKETDIVLSYHQDGEQFPVRGLQCSSEQMPQIKEKFENYNLFASANLADVYSEKALNQSEIHFSINSFSSQIWWSNATEKYDKVDLPNDCQISAINSIQIADVDQDGKDDLILGGNLFTSEVETKRNDASIGQVLKNNGARQLETIPYTESGLMISKDVRDMEILITNHQRLLLIANNNDHLQILKF